MRALQLTAANTFAVTSLPDPLPGPGQVLVRWQAAALNFRDVQVARGSYPNTAFPLIPGSDAAGTVEACGPGATRWKPGDRVLTQVVQGWQAGEMLPYHPRTILGGVLPGVLCERSALPEDGLVATPAHLSDQEAACLPCAGTTAWNALHGSGTTRPGDTVLVQGSGGVALWALLLARAAGARVLAITSSPAKAERLRALGAEAVHDYRADPAWDAWALAASGGAGVDHVIEVGGPGTIARSIAAVRFHGRISLIGVLTGVAGEVPTAALFRKHICLQGIFCGPRTMSAALARAVAQHRLRPVVDRVFPLDQAAQAFAHLASGSHLGKVVVGL